MWQMKEYRIGIHDFVSGVIALGAVEVALVYWEYNQFNRTGIRDFQHTVLISVISSLRSTLANLFFLVTSLGYGTLTSRLGRYAQSIGVMAFLLFVAGTVNNTFHYLTQSRQIKESVRVAAFLPMCVFF